MGGHGEPWRAAGFAAGAALTGDNAITPLAAGIVLSGTNRAGLVTYTSPGNGTTIGLLNNYANSSDSFKRYVDIVSFGSTGGVGAFIRFLVGNGSGATPQVALIDSTGLNSTAIGATTASTGAFTTLALSDKITATKSGSNADYDVLTARNANVGNDTSTRILLGQDTSAVAGFIQMTGTNNATYPSVFRLGTNISGTSVAVVVNTSTIGTFSSTGLAVTGALSCTGNADFGTTASSARITLGHATNATVDNSIILRTGSTKTAWQIGAQFNVDNGFEITPSTAVGGTTFSTPVATFSSTGLAVTGALSATGTITSSVATGSRTLQATASVSVANDVVQNLVTQNYGFFFISEITITGAVAIIAFNASGPYIVWQNGASYTVTANTASKFNVYYSSGNQLVVQNKAGSTASFNIINFAGSS